MNRTGKPSALDMMQYLYDSEFGGVEGFGSGFADALSNRKALNNSFSQPGAREAFESVVGWAKDPETRLRFSALVADMATPAGSDFTPEQPFRFGLQMAAFNTFTKTLIDQPAAAFKTLQEYPDYFSNSQHIARMSTLFIGHHIQVMAEGRERETAQTAQRYIASSNSLA